mmetsp:Transcript_17657/g.50293  ORF Transcript_17657/g.50293 Transcript_17657/m.50293 type:complete len:273 (+) Transcript_17657:624-1442(+)
MLPMPSRMRTVMAAEGGLSPSATCGRKASSRRARSSPSATKLANGMPRNLRPPQRISIPASFGASVLRRNPWSKSTTTSQRRSRRDETAECWHCPKRASISFFALFSAAPSQAWNIISFIVRIASCSIVYHTMGPPSVEPCRRIFPTMVQAHTTTLVTARSLIRRQRAPTTAEPKKTAVSRKAAMSSLNSARASVQTMSMPETCIMGKARSVKKRMGKMPTTVKTIIVHARIIAASTTNSPSPKTCWPRIWAPKKQLTVHMAKLMALAYLTR